MSTIALLPGTFDPFTLGHEDIARRAAALFERLIVGVSAGGRATLFTADERLAIVKNCLANMPNVEVVLFSGLLIDVCAKFNARVVVRGVRSFADFEYESEMASLNRQMSPQVDTIYLSTSDALRSISGSRVREIAKLGGPFDGFVNPQVAIQVRAKVASAPG
jgi:pantetheine-phosphate adenylyltransferase